MRTYILIALLIAFLSGCTENPIEEKLNPEWCGDGLINGGEQCDDGNVANDDGCTNICTIGQSFHTPEPGGPTLDEVTTENEWRWMQGNQTFAIYGRGYQDGLPIYEIIRQTENMEFCGAWATPPDLLWEGDIPPANSKRIVLWLHLQGGDHILECWNEVTEIRQTQVVNPPGT